MEWKGEKECAGDVYAKAAEYGRNARFTQDVKLLKYRSAGFIRTKMKSKK